MARTPDREGKGFINAPHDGLRGRRQRLSGNFLIYRRTGVCRRLRIHHAGRREIVRLMVAPPPGTLQRQNGLSTG